MWQTFKFGHKNNSCQNKFFGWTQPPWRVPRLSSTSCAALLQATNSGWNVTTPPAPANTRSSSFGISDKERLSHSLPCETAPKRSSSNLAADASSTYGIRHTATTKQQSSYNIAPCDKHATFVTILFCPTEPACVVPRHPAIERAALQPQATSCPVHGQHSEHVPFCEAPWQKFLPGHPGAIHDPWSQHCYAAPATEFPRHRTTRTTRSHAPFARTFPSANETATTKCPQTSRVRDLNQTCCIQKFRDMHICSLDFKKMPWHAWFQNKTMPWHAWFQNKEFEFRTILCHWATLVQTTASLCGLNLGVARTIESSCIAVALHFNIQFPTKLPNAVNYMHHTVLEGNIHKGTTNPTAW